MQRGALRNIGCVDPVQWILTVLEWVEGLYEEKIFQGQIVSGLLGVLQLTVEQVLRGCQ